MKPLTICADTEVKTSEFQDLKAGDIFRRPGSQDTFMRTNEDNAISLKDGVGFNLHRDTRVIPATPAYLEVRFL